MNGLLTAREAAERLRVNINTLYRYLLSGQLKATKVGGTWRIKVESLEGFINGK